jgi:glycosyltransferase involved in cell wall biosynthesis
MSAAHSSLPSLSAPADVAAVSPAFTRPVRVAHFTMGRCNPESANGVDKTVYHLARTQAALGHEVAVFSLTHKPALPIPGVRVATCPPLRPLPFLMTGRQRDLFGARSPWNVPSSLVAAIRNWGPDVLHLHFVHIPPNVFLARRFSPAVPYCVTINGGLSPDAQRRNRWIKRLFRAMFERDYLERAAFLHVISEQDIEGVETYGVKNTLVLAPNGIDVAPLPGDPPSDAFARLDSRLQNRQVFLYLGRLDPQQKGLDLLVRAFAASRPEGWALVLMGPDWRSGRTALESLARSLGIDDRVVLPGPVFGHHKNELLLAAQVFVHPSRWEAGVPFSVLEAAALERPCLLTPMADSQRLLAHSGGAISVAPSVDGIAEGLRRISAQSLASLRMMGSRARATVTAEFSWERTATTVIDAYRRYAVERRG